MLRDALYTRENSKQMCVSSYVRSSVWAWVVSLSLFSRTRPWACGCVPLVEEEQLSPSAPEPPPPHPPSDGACRLACTLALRERYSGHPDVISQRGK